MDDHPVAREVVLDDFHVDSRAIDAIVRRHAYGHSEHIAERVYYKLLRMSDSPLVSVVMSVHNASAVVGQAIESILKQTFTNFEFIIIDDGSTDNLRELLADINDARIKYYFFERVGRGCGVRGASGDWIFKERGGSATESLIS